MSSSDFYCLSFISSPFYRFSIEWAWLYHMPRFLPAPFPLVPSHPNSTTLTPCTEPHRFSKSKLSLWPSAPFSEGGGHVLLLPGLVQAPQSGSAWSGPDPSSLWNLPLLPVTVSLLQPRLFTHKSQTVHELPYPSCCCQNSSSFLPVFPSPVRD